MNASLLATDPLQSCDAALQAFHREFSAPDRFDLALGLCFRLGFLVWH